ncbi:MAG: hypothetical protein JSS81_28290 [Acidobacteria bacterium]|nr:hypothetical protein [Acidobacteriota bacterium]
MPIEETRLTTEVSSTRELNKYLKEGWILILSYVKHLSDSQQPRFVLAWQKEDKPVRPELLDEWDLHELDRSRSG